MRKRGIGLIVFAASLILASFAAEISLRVLDANLAAVDVLAARWGFRTGIFWEPCLFTKRHLANREIAEAIGRQLIVHGRLRRRGVGEEPVAHPSR